MRIAITLLAPITLATLLLSHAGDASAEIYRWTDSKGKDHFVMHIDEVPERYRQQALEGAKNRPGLQTHKAPPPPRVRTITPPAAKKPGAGRAKRAKGPTAREILRTTQQQLDDIRDGDKKDRYYTEEIQTGPKTPGMTARRTYMSQEQIIERGRRQMEKAQKMIDAENRRAAEELRRKREALRKRKGQ